MMASSSVELTISVPAHLHDRVVDLVRTLPPVTMDDVYEAALLQLFEAVDRTDFEAVFRSEVDAGGTDEGNT